MTDYARDPDNLHGDEKILVIELAVRRNGAMSITGSINEDPTYLCALLDEAKDTIKRHHLRAGKSLLITPARDVPAGDVRFPLG